MDLSDKLLKRQAKLAVVGLGYVGMPLAIEYAKYIDVVGYDVNQAKVKKYLEGIDVTGEVGDAAIRDTKVKFTSDVNDLQGVDFFIIAVPTPISQDKMPDLSPVVSSSRTVGKYIKKGSYVVYESTVYPGVTEDICLPTLEEESGLKCGIDFRIGYSPERINPGDKIHTLTNITKIVSGIDEEALDVIANVYSIIIKNNIFRASSIKVAEAAKVVENSQRDINIAFMNELAMVFDKMKIDTMEVVEAMNTKWNALRFTPGLVGGHCIGVDPYYFIYRAEQLGYHSQIILSGRKINDSMSEFIAEVTIKKMIQADIKVRHAKVGILGITFKENCPDVRNTKVVEIIKKLREYEVEIAVSDYQADSEEVMNHYGISLVDKLEDLDVLIIAVAHDKYRGLKAKEYKSYFKDSKSVVIDVKSVLSKDESKNIDYYWKV